MFSKYLLIQNRMVYLTYKRMEIFTYESKNHIIYPSGFKSPNKRIFSGFRGFTHRRLYNDISIGRILPRECDNCLVVSLGTAHFDGFIGDSGLDF